MNKLWGVGLGLAAVVGALGVGTGGCELVAVVDRNELRGTGGSLVGGAGGSGGSGGTGGVACDPLLCPAGTTACEVPVCLPDDTCGLDPAPARTACTDVQNPDGVLCDGQGSCVECVDQTDCAGTDLCETGSCVPESCSNLTQDGDETDVDCGGSCSPCVNGDACVDASDCESGFCNALVCAACTLDVDCGAGNYCEAGGTCAPQKLGGTVCAAANECASGFCPADDLVCCDVACDGTCEACLAAKNGNAGNGTCGPVPAAADPDTECPAGAATCRLGGCNGSGQCSPAPDGTLCRAGSGDACDPDETCAGGSCPTDTVAPASTVCRTGSGDSCDPNETCPGTAGAACPADVVASAVTECRPKNGSCDVAESCPGVAGQACPADAVVADGTAGSPSCVEYLCDGLAPGCPGSCVDSTDCAPTYTCNTGPNRCQ
ncbi:MAG: hypothetical protein IT373_24640 [Polyangiaceae bacterium]|nr:hypothetical protein [Polyangiaceae bacterium]